MTPEKLLENLDASTDKDKSLLIKDLKFAIKCSFVEEFLKGDERPCENSDFEELKKYHEVHVRNMKLIFDKIKEKNYLNQSSSNFEEIDSCRKSTKKNIQIDSELISLILIMCGENTELKPWNTDETVKNCASILSTLLELFECDNLVQLVSSNENGNIAKITLQILRPKLLQTTWKHFPASVLVYKWILRMIKQREMSSYLPLVLPTALLLVDDFVNENRIDGVKCLHYITDNVTAAELQFHGHGDVVYSALLPLLRIRESDLFNVVLPCLVSLTTKLEINFGQKDVTKWSKFDDILEIYLENMELEQLVALRNCYIENLELIIVSSGLSVIRWSKRLLRIFREYVQVSVRHSDEKTIDCCLKVIEQYLQNAQPVAHLFGENLFFTLLIPLYYTLIKSECDKVSEQQKVVINCIKKLLDLLSENEKVKIMEQCKEKFSENTVLQSLYNLIKNCKNESND